MAASLGCVVGLATVTVVELTFWLYEFAQSIGWPFLAFLVFGVVSAGAAVIRMQTSPKVLDVLRRRATVREFALAHGPLLIVQHASAFLATWLTTTLVLGVSAVRDYALGRVEHALSAVGL